MGKNTEFMLFHIGPAWSLIKTSNETNNYLNINLLTGDRGTISKQHFYNKPPQFHLHKRGTNCCSTSSARPLPANLTLIIP